MGLLEKLKNTFFEEEYVEVEEKETKKKTEEKVEPKVEKIEEKPVVKDYDEVEDEILEDEEDTIEEETYSDRDLVNKNNKLTYYDDDDFEPTKSIPVVKKEEPTRIYGETSDTLYSSIKVDDIKDYSSISHRAYGATEENKFEPTPIISPIYGILDKNYRKEEVIDKKDKPSSYVSRKNVDLDSVRRKAYGEDAIATPVKEEEKEEPIIYDNLTEELDNKPVVDQVTVGDAEEYFNDLGLEYNIDYKDKHYENATGRRSDAYINEESNDLYDEVVINDNAGIDYPEEDNNITMDDLMSVEPEHEEVEEAHLEDNLFDLVDSMYEDGE